MSTETISASRTVLIVDDDDLLRDVLCRLLRRLGYVVIDAKHAADAVRLLESSGDAIDAVVTDVYMPGMRGSELAEVVRTNRPETPVVFMSGYDEGDMVRNGIDTSSKFLKKPFTISELQMAMSSRAGVQVGLSVSDTGTGMDPKIAAKVFEPFFTTKGVGKGTGLGLATVYGIVQQAGGDIRLDTTPSIGTTFEMTFPLAIGQAPSEAVQAPPLEPARKSETILLVEDDSAVRSLGHRILSDRGYRVTSAASGSDAIHFFRAAKQPFDLLVADVVMPGMSGGELADRLTTLHPEIRILLISGYTDDEVLRRGIIENELPFLQKPFTPSQLADKVSEVLRTKRKETQRLKRMLRLA
ncbi:MAG: response regulator [Gemmatimonadaceae bacterium]|nr:response regulator [Gemmatimonadaceae bacterium]